MGHGLNVKKSSNNQACVTCIIRMQYTIVQGTTNFFFPVLINSVPNTAMTQLLRVDSHSFILSWLLCLHHRLRTSINGVQEGQNFSSEDGGKK